MAAEATEMMLSAAEAVAAVVTVVMAMMAQRRGHATINYKSAAVVGKIAVKAASDTEALARWQGR